MKLASSISLAFLKSLILLPSTTEYFLNKFLTIRSSNEWNVITHTLPLIFNELITSSKAFFKTLSSLFTSILMA